jgi:hypothetical protein
MFIKVAIVLFLSLEIESWALPEIPPSKEIPYDRIMRVLKPATFEVDSS